MKAIRSCLAIVCSLLFAFALTSALAKDAGENPTRFGTPDLTVNGVGSGSSGDDVKGELGNPKEIKFFDGTAEDQAREVWYYDGMELTFQNNRLVRAKVFMKGFKGPRDVQVGDPITGVIRKFFVSPNKTSGTVFYWNEAAGEFSPNQPDCGYMEVNADGTYVLTYLALSNPTVDEVMMMDQGNASGGGVAVFTVNADSSGVTSYEWSLN
jgi:hypothetical protein